MPDPATKEDVQELTRWVRSLDRAIRGHNGTPGIAARVDANEKFISRVTWHVRVVWVAILGGAGTAIARAFW